MMYCVTSESPDTGGNQVSSTSPEDLSRIALKFLTGPGAAKIQCRVIRNNRIRLGSISSIQCLLCKAASQFLYARQFNHVCSSHRMGISVLPRFQLLMIERYRSIVSQKMHTVRQPSLFIGRRSVVDRYLVLFNTL